MKVKLIITAAVVLMGFTACKRGTADPNALPDQAITAEQNSVPADITFAADDTTSMVNTDTTTTAVPEAAAKEQLAAQQEPAAKKTPAAKKKPAAKQKRPADPVPVQYSSKNHPSSWSKSQIKWASIVEQHGTLQVGDAAARMSNSGTEAYNGVYSLYAVHRYLYLGNHDEALVQWAKFNVARNGSQSKLLNDLFEVSKSIDDTFAKFVAGHPKKKKK